jgi:hypothetical protein
MVPYWIVQKRAQICANCDIKQTCSSALVIMLENTVCPKNKFTTAQEDIAEKAWPKDAPRISGCCDPIGSCWGGE